jgi:hypothetical protein
MSKFTYKLTEKENYLRMLKGEMPEFLPRYKIVEYVVMPSFMAQGHITPGGGTDIYGVKYVAEDTAGGGALPEPGNFILDDITKWREVIKNPDTKSIDWESIARADLANADFTKPRLANVHRGFFQSLMSFMGFTEGLCALAEEPEECKALFEYLGDFGLEVLKQMITHYKIDGVAFADDTAAAQYPFISLDMYRTLIKPIEMKFADVARENGIPIHVHNCGRCEQFIDDWLDMGISAWDPAQVANDLLGIKKKYGRKLVLCGCWDQQGRVSWLDTPDQELKDGIIEYVDTFAPGGAFAYVPFVLGPRDHPDVARKNKIIDDYYEDYAKDWYKTHS